MSWGSSDLSEEAGDKDTVRQVQRKWGFVLKGLHPGLRRGRAGHLRLVSRQQAMQTSGAEEPGRTGRQPGESGR